MRACSRNLSRCSNYAGRVPADDKRFAVRFDARLEPQCQRGRAAGLAHGPAEVRVVGGAFELRLDRCSNYAGASPRN